ncbi:MAG: response regulator [Candidatus Obscuribacter sp.]|nr:response regulator [Candidatus Obscuribacter sp.]MBL8083664.1 response regulator [Candidatus Obscuribacter sp.]
MSFRLLLIEDSPTQLLTISKTLQAEGYSVIEARNGAEGLARAYHEAPDLIISDVVMTGINGYQLCRLVKNDPDLATIPVILLTKLDGSVDRFWGYQSGAERYIPKEPGFRSLIKSIQEILEDPATKPRLRVLTEPTKTLTHEDINNRLNQLLERLLFEATIAEEVRKIAEDVLDIESVTEKLFELLSTILDYQAVGLVVNRGQNSVLKIDADENLDQAALRAYIAKLSLQLGLPPLKDDQPRGHYLPDNSLCQPIDIKGQRLGLLVVIPYPQQTLKPGDQKVLRLIGDQLSPVLRLLDLHLNAGVARERV